MRKSIFLFLAVFLILFVAARSVPAGEVDILLEKLVEKRILSGSEAKEIVKEIQKEREKENREAKEIAAEIAKELVKKQSKDGPFELPKWVTSVKPFGDLRLRHDTQWINKDSGSDTRNRERFRLRLGVKSQIADSVEVGFRLASGSGFQNTTNQSFDSHSRGKHIFIDRAYAKWKPCDYFTFVGGKQKNPLFSSPLVWDPDVNPEGFSESLNFGINDNVSFFANFGQWVIEEIKSKNSDPTLLAFQLGTAIKPAEKMKIQFAATYYEYLNMGRTEYDSGDIGDPETFIGYNNKYGQQMVFDDDGKLLNEFGCLELGLKATFKEVLSVPFSIFGSYIVNFEADIDDLTRKGLAYTSTNPSNLLAYGGDDRDKGWLVGFDFGNKKKKGDWYFKYWYQVLEDYAFPAVFVDSDFHGGGTNNKGHKIHARYLFTDKISARVSAYITERDSEKKDGKFEEDRIQLDVLFAFP